MMVSCSQSEGEHLAGRFRPAGAEPMTTPDTTGTLLVDMPYFQEDLPDEWTHDPVTGEDIWTPKQDAIVPTGCPGSLDDNT